MNKPKRTCQIVITLETPENKERKTGKAYHIPSINGSVAETGKISEAVITVIGDIAGTNYDDLRTNLDTLKVGLHNGLQKFTTDDDRYIMAQLTSFIHYTFPPARHVVEFEDNN